MAMYKYQAAEGEVSWLFAESGAAIGFGAQSYDPDGRGGSVDGPDRRSVHMASLKNEDKSAQGARAGKAFRIRDSLARVSADDRALFEECYASRVLPPIAAREPDPDGKLVSRIGLFAARQEAQADAEKRRSDLTSWLTDASDGRHVCVVGALGRSSIAARAFAQVGGGGRARGPQTVGEYLTTLSADNAALFKRVREEILVLLGAALARYDAVRTPGPKNRYSAAEDRQTRLRGYQGDARGLSDLTSEPLT